jgi:hypothetical protein
MRSYRQLVDVEAEYIMSRQQAVADPLADGFIFHADQSIVPYFANQAATALALTKESNRLAAVARYLHWYFRNLNWPDELGLYGTTYDYRQVGGQWQPDLTIRAGTHPHYYDSVDAYAATFLTLLRAYVAADGGTQLLMRHANQIEAISGLMVNMMDPADGLAIAKPTYPVKYLMDNCEVYKGLQDAAWLFRVVFQDPTKADYFAQMASLNRKGILTDLFNGLHFAVYKTGKQRGAVNWSKWYPDAVSQLFPAIFGVIDPNDDRAGQAYQRLNRQFPRWHTFSSVHTKESPWALIAYAATLMENTDDFERYRASVEPVYIHSGNPWPWHVAEAAWFLMASLRMDHLAAGWRGYP